MRKPCPDSPSNTCAMRSLEHVLAHFVSLLRCLLATCSLLLASAAVAQTFPVRPVRVIVNFPPGAGVDISTRLVTAKLSEALGQQFLVDNRAGAAGNIGIELASRAAERMSWLLHR